MIQHHLKTFGEISNGAHLLLIGENVQIYKQSNSQNLQLLNAVCDETKYKKNGQLFSFSL